MSRLDTIFEHKRDEVAAARSFRSLGAVMAEAVAAAPALDFVFTVCGNAAKEACPAWPGQPVSAHWGVDDPAAAEGSDEEKRRAFRRAYVELEGRIKVFTALPIDKLDLVALKRRLDDIGRLPPLDTR